MAINLKEHFRDENAILKKDFSNKTIYPKKKKDYISHRSNRAKGAKYWPTLPLIDYFLRNSNTGSKAAK